MPGGTIGKARPLYYRDADEHGAYTLYFREIGRFKQLPDEEIVGLVEKVRRSQDLDARNRLVEHNLRLVVSIARRYQGLGLELLELVQEGNLGLIHAAELFDPGIARFSTYAYYWIEQKVRRALDNQSRVIRVPVHALKRIRDLKRAHGQLANALRREPLPQELAEKLDVLIEEIEQTFRDMRVTTVTFEDLTASEIDEDKDVLDRIGALRDVRPNPEEALITKEDQERVSRELQLFLGTIKSLTGVSERNKTIFLLRHGLDGTFTAKTLEAIGEKFHMTRERVRQIVQAVLKAVRKEHPEMPLFALPKESGTEDSGMNPPTPVDSTERSAPAPRTVLFSLKEQEKKAMGFIADFLGQKEPKVHRRTGVRMAIDHIREGLKGRVPKEVAAWFTKRLEIQASLAYYRA